VSRGALAFSAAGLALLAGCATAPQAAPPPPPLADSAPPPPASAIAQPVLPAQPPAAMQWLYGSGEGAAASLQAYDAFRSFVLARARSRPAQSVVLDSGATLQSPRFLPCGDRPLAVVLDVDETVLQNLGAEYDEAAHPGRPFSEDRWLRWEQTGAAAVAAMPGAVAALGAIRDAGVTVIFNSNRTAGNAAQTAAALEAVGLGPARHGETLYLKGDVAPGSGKDPRRAAIAERYCVVAMAGDQLGDFSDRFNERSLAVPDRRAAAASPPFASLWGNGWFLLSNPVYGPSIRGTIDEVFPADKRWSDPQGENGD
jgi:5'-nucleotidase (lipoprotein e(P4) family)